MAAEFNFSNDFLAAQRKLGDNPADDFINRCFADSDLKKGLQTWLSQLNVNQDLDQIPHQFNQEDFLQNGFKLPEWADPKVMQAGSAFFVLHAEQIMQLLGLLSLPYCYAAADGAMVLYQSERLRNDVEKRLIDTAEFIWDVMAPSAFTVTGKGFSSLLKIRLTHAAARYYTTFNSTWDFTLGVPINQEDMAGTNLSFSLIVIRGLRKLGLTISYNEQQSFLHLWNVIGYLLGLKEELIPKTGKSANALELAIRKRHFRTSVQGRELTKILCDFLASASPENISPKDTFQLMRHLLEDEVSDILNIPYFKVPGYLPYVLKVATNLTVNNRSAVQVLYQQKYLAFKKQNIRR
jgi:hypothetical protein